MDFLQEIVERITTPDPALGDKAQAHLDSLTKPRGSLGRLEDLARQLCVLRGSLKLSPPRAAVAVFAADHGVTQAGVSLYPAEVTPQMVFNFLAGGAGINVLAGLAGASVRVVDVGVNYQFDDLPGLTKAKVAPGTANMLVQPAMTPEQTRQAVEVGARVALELMDQGHDVLIPGDMGIGNTTACSALTAVFCAKHPREVTGRGTGLDDQGLVRKVQAIEQALALHRPDPDDPWQVLAAVGGLEIAAICGFCLAAASRRVPVLLDGFISTTGALCAAKIRPPAASYFIVGHGSVEIGHRAQCDFLGQKPLLDLNLRLGEGTGAVLALYLVQAAVAIFNQMATFASAGVSDQEV